MTWRRRISWARASIYPTSPPRKWRVSLYRIDEDWGILEEMTPRTTRAALCWILVVLAPECVRANENHGHLHGAPSTRRVVSVATNDATRSPFSPCAPRHTVALLQIFSIINAIPVKVLQFNLFNRSPVDIDRGVALEETSDGCTAHQRCSYGFDRCATLRSLVDANRLVDRRRLSMPTNWVVRWSSSMPTDGWACQLLLARRSLSISSDPLTQQLLAMSSNPLARRSLSMSLNVLAQRIGSLVNVVGPASSTTFVIVVGPADSATVVNVR